MNSQNNGTTTFGGVFKIVVYVFLSIILLAALLAMASCFGLALYGAAHEPKVSESAKEIGNANPDKPYPTAKVQLTLGTVTVLNNSKTDWPSLSVVIDDKFGRSVGPLAKGAKMKIPVWRFKNPDGDFQPRLDERHEVKIVVSDWNPLREDCFVQDKSDF
jgi:hypothetical protein